MVCIYLFGNIKRVIQIGVYGGIKWNVWCYSVEDRTGFEESLRVSLYFGPMTMCRLRTTAGMPQGSRGGPKNYLFDTHVLVCRYRVKKTYQTSVIAKLRWLNTRYLIIRKFQTC